MVVMSDKGNTFNVPEQYSPHYLMDSLGFYRNGVSGKFPKDLTTEGKGQFAKEMVELGAVIFRRARMAAAVFPSSSSTRAAWTG